MSDEALTRTREVREVVGRGHAGFGLIEVIVAMVILAVGILSITGVLTQSIAMQTMSSQRASALYIANTTMEQIRAMEPATVAAVVAQSVDEDGDVDANGVFTREVTVTDVSGNIVEVTVIVTMPRSEPIRLVVWIYDSSV